VAGGVEIPFLDGGTKIAPGFLFSKAGLWAADKKLPPGNVSYYRTVHYMFLAPPSATGGTYAEPGSVPNLQAPLSKSIARSESNPNSKNQFPRTNPKPVWNLVLGIWLFF
jgi:hypothetical protein